MDIDIVRNYNTNFVFIAALRGWIIDSWKNPFHVVEQRRRTSQTYVDVADL